MTHFEQHSKAHQMHREHEKRARGAKLLEGEFWNLQIFSNMDPRT